VRRGEAEDSGTETKRMQYGVLHGRAGLRGYVLPAERIAAVDKTGLQEGDCMAASDIGSTL